MLFSALLQYLASLGIQSRVQQGATQGKVAHKLMDALKDTDILHWKHSLSELIEISLAQTTSIWRMYGKRSDAGRRARVQYSWFRSYQREKFWFCAVPWLCNRPSCSCT